MTEIIQLNNDSKYFLENILVPLEKDEIYFISLSARNKYLSQEDREKYALSRTEMFAREVVTTNNSWDYVFRKLDGLLKAKRTKTGFPFPTSALVTYVNINPSSAIKAVLQFKKELMEIEENLFRKVLINNNDVNDFDYDFFKKAKSKLFNAYQRQTSRKCFVDIDVDIKNEKILKILLDSLTKYKSEYAVIETRGGYHIMVKSSTLSGNFLYKSVDEAKDEASRIYGREIEIMFNKNAMVPVPGTMHGDFYVKLVEDKLTHF